MNVDDAFEKLREITNKGYGQTEISINSYAEIEEQPIELDDVCLYEHKTNPTIVEFVVS